MYMGKESYLRNSIRISHRGCHLESWTFAKTRSSWKGTSAHSRPLCRLLGYSVASNVTTGGCKRLLDTEEESDDLTNDMTDFHRDSKGLLVSLTADSVLEWLEEVRHAQIPHRYR